MTDRHTVDSITSDALDALYAECDRLTAELADYDERAEQQKQRADRAEEECRRYAEAESADAAAGSYAGRAERVETRLARVQRLLDSGPIGTCCAHLLRAALAHDEPAIAHPEPWLHVAFTSPDDTTANTSALAIADHPAAEFDGVRMRITTNAVEAGPLAPAEEGDLAQSGVDTPGCDCGHDGMGVSWHGDDCPWRCGVLDGKVTAPPDPREQITAVLRSLSIIGGTPPRLLVPVLTGGGSQLAVIADWQPLDDLVDTMHAIVTGHAASITGELRTRAAQLTRRAVELEAMARDAEQPQPTANNPAGSSAHVYLSTGCFHGDHDYCKSMTGLNGAKRPAECKKCAAKCVCPCHGGEQQS